MPGTSDQWTALDRRYERLVSAGPDLFPPAGSRAGTDADPGSITDAGPGTDADSPADSGPDSAAGPPAAVAAQAATPPAATPHVGRHRRLDGAGAAAMVAA
jgi:hypothetical protein